MKLVKKIKRKIKQFLHISNVIFKTNIIARFQIKVINNHHLIKNLKSQKILLFACVKNEKFRINSFLDHYRKMGIKVFVIVDNDSNDGTREILLEQDDVLLLYTKHSYKKSIYSLSWMNYLLRKYGYKKWCILVDADELLVYDNYEKKDIHILLDELETFNINILYTPLIEIYHKKICSDNLNNTININEMYFDKYGYYKYYDKKLDSFLIWGGMRKRVFFDKYSESPVITKFSLFYNKKNIYYINSTHEFWPKNKLQNQYNACLLHTKYLSDFIEKCKNINYIKQHYNSGFEYKIYAKKLKRNNYMYIYNKNISTKFISSQELVNYNLITSIFDKEYTCEIIVFISFIEYKKYFYNKIKEKNIKKEIFILYEKIFVENIGKFIDFKEYETSYFLIKLLNNKKDIKININVESVLQFFEFILKYGRYNNIKINFLYSENRNLQTNYGYIIENIRHISYKYNVDIEFIFK